MNETLPVSVPYASLDIEKEATVSAAVAGKEVVYLVTVVNNGNTAIRDVYVDETLPAGLTYVAAEYDSSVLVFGGTSFAPSWGFAAPLEPGAIHTIRITALVDQDPANVPEPVTNRIAVRGETSDGNPVTDETTESLPLRVGFSALDVTKSAAGAVIVPGELVLYYIHVENTGDAPLANVAVTEAVPAGLTYVASDFDSGDVAFTGTPAVPAWTIADLPVGASEFLSVWFLASYDPTTIANPAVNRVTVEGEDAGGDPVTDDARNELPVRSLRSSIRLEKTALEPVVQPGEPVSYLIRATNTGHDSLYALEIRDAIPTGLAFTDASFDSTRLALATGIDSLVWTMAAPLAPGDLVSTRVTFVATEFDSVFGVAVSNTAAAEARNAGGVTVTDDATETVPVERPDAAINIQKTTSEPLVTAGREVIYTITVTNVGNRDLTGAIIEEIVPPGLTYRSAQIDPVTTAFTGTVESPAWTIANFPRRATETFTVRFLADPDPGNIPDPVVNEVTVRALDPSGAEVQDRDDESTPVQASAPALNIEKVATQGSGMPGGEITYLITVFNNGRDPLTDVSVQDVPDAGLVYLASGYDNVHVTETTAGDGPSWFLPNLRVGGFEQIRATFAVREDTLLVDSLANVALASGTDLFGTSVADTAREVVPVALSTPSIHVDKNATQGSYTPGELVTYHLTITNTGSTDLSNVFIRENPPAILEFKYANFDNIALDQPLTDNPLVWSISSFPVGAVEELRVTFLAAAALPSSFTEDSLVTNGVTVSAITTAGQTVADTAWDALPVELERSGLQVLKWADFSAAPTYEGSEVAYHVLVTNTGEQRLTNVMTTDYLPPGLSFAYADLDPESVGPDTSGQYGGIVKWDIGDLEPQESWEVLVIARIDRTLKADTEIQNRAVAVAYDEVGDMVQDEDVSKVRVSAPELTIEKIADRARVKPGDPLTYSILYRNIGDVAAVDIAVTDLVAPGIEIVPGTVSDGAVYDERNRTVSLAVGTLLPGGFGSFRYEATVSNDAAFGECIPNTASLYASLLDGITTDTVFVCVDSIPADIRKSVDREVAEAGDTLQYTLTYEVVGGVVAGAMVSDAVPGLTEYVSGSAVPAASYDPGSQMLTWDLGTLANGAIGTVRY
ncbi:MAG: DUF11 domain-containing protein, partial [Gemmatimonadetes bacterium]|nr:DUF11 domain-containing protein [Gemmatimonadota bacterium]